MKTYQIIEDIDIEVGGVLKYKHKVLDCGVVTEALTAEHVAAVAGIRKTRVIEKAVADTINGEDYAKYTLFCDDEHGRLRIVALVVRDETVLKIRIHTTPKRSHVESVSADLLKIPISVGLFESAKRATDAVYQWFLQNRFCENYNRIAVGVFEAICVACNCGGKDSRKDSPIILMDATECYIEIYVYPEK